MSSNKGDPADAASAAAKTQRDDTVIRIATAAVVAIIVGAAVANPQAAYDIIQSLRTFITEYFGWWIILAALLALILCLWIAFGKYRSIRLGGSDAKPEYSRFAWYSMLFACGQGIGLIFWSVAEPILVRADNPLLDTFPVGADNGAMAWSYFHWAITAWAIYGIVAVCMAYARFNRGQSGSFRGSCQDILPKQIRRGGGLVIEWLAIITTILGLATSFGFASMQFSSGVSSLFGIESSLLLKIGVIVVIGLITAISVFVGVQKGMQRISKANSVLSIALLVLVFAFGPTLFLLHLIPESIGTYLQTFVPMSTFMDASSVGSLSTWADSWNGAWSVFIFCWCFAFSPFVASFIASISRGRTLREFVLGIIGIPSIVVIVWIGIIGGTALRFDDALSGAITAAVMQDTSSGLFAMGQAIPYIGALVVAISTILVGTYFITSIDSGVHALSGFVSTAAKPSAPFKAVLVVLIAVVTLVLLLLGGDGVLDTIQTGTIVGALPFTAIVVIMVANFIRSVRKDPQICSTAPQADGGEADSVGREASIE
ncbi:BCCT family transporter [Raoultibacter timonensis]|uniref:Glycine/betaine ABC transporter permease n=1 Tax=Raoultibacter timonensis TaxID=1907662 RepID=A0ABM7WMP5_9ACTN|nr:BCCT family transporter [Raoultibacter timonensis]BDE97698.1 glycine/betaine ABC transporter permease [Raoultibacter timonensis]BDF52301.1 glycine/betaine ABC transporter permease [Raoultibacter timonensis]